MPTRKLVIPRFANEDAEGRWWARNSKVVQADMLRRLQAGEGISLAEALRLVQAKEKASLKPVTIRMPTADLATARHLARLRGLPYQTYIKMLLREGLRRDLAHRPKARG
jgi:predicted DNA binding CopG/RHH family protein